MSRDADFEACDGASVLARAQRLLAAKPAFVEVEALLLVAAVFLTRPDIILSVRSRILKHRALILLRPERYLRVVVQNVVGVRNSPLSEQLDLAVFALLS